MGYKMPIVCKEIYLPILTNNTSLEEYKEMYGINLKEFIRIRNNEIQIVFPHFTKVFLVYNQEDTYPNISKVGMPNRVGVVQYSAGSSAAHTQIIYEDHEEGYGFGLIFEVDKDLDLTVDNIVINDYEI